MHFYWLNTANDNACSFVTLLAKKFENVATFCSFTIINTYILSDPKQEKIIINKKSHSFFYFLSLIDYSCIVIIPDKNQRRYHNNCFWRQGQTIFQTIIKYMPHSWSLVASSRTLNRDAHWVIRWKKICIPDGSSHVVPIFVAPLRWGSHATSMFLKTNKEMKSWK